MKPEFGAQMSFAGSTTTNPHPSAGCRQFASVSVSVRLPSIVGSTHGPPDDEPPSSRAPVGLTCAHAAIGETAKRAAVAAATSTAAARQRGVLPNWCFSWGMHDMLSHPFFRAGGRSIDRTQHGIGRSGGRIRLFL